MFGSFRSLQFLQNHFRAHPPQKLLIFSPRLHISIPPTRNHPSFDHQKHIQHLMKSFLCTFSMDSVLHDSITQTSSNNLWVTAQQHAHWCEIYSRSEWFADLGQWIPSSVLIDLVLFWPSVWMGVDLSSYVQAECFSSGEFAFSWDTRRNNII